MKRLTRTFPLILAAALQLVPLMRNLVTSPAASSSFAFILRWGIGSAAAVGAYDACSGATNSFAGPTSFVGTNGIGFTNNLTLTTKTQGDGLALCTVLTNSVVAALLSNTLGQTTTNGMPAGLTFKFIDLNSGSLSFSNVYCVISGKPTKNGTNSFHVDLSRSGSTSIPGDFTIVITSGSAGTPPIITNQPTSLTNNVGNNATFSVTAGTAPLSYQWYFNTNTALLNQTNASLTVTNVQLTNAGMYSVTITNSAGTTNSAFAALTVWQPPIITNQPASLTNNVGNNATFAVTAGGTAPLHYQWFFNTNSALLNQTNASLTVTNVQLTNAGMYSVTITNSAGTTNSVFAALTVWQPPIITNHPASFTSVAGGAVTFSVTAGGTPAPAYQWKFNTNSALIGATGTTLPLANLRANQTGFYSVTVTNAAGATNSFFALLTVTNPPPPVIAGKVGTSGAFQFTFTPVVGLTNTVLTNGVLGGTNWGVFTNLPPPASATPITFSNVVGSPNLFYRVMIQP